MTDQGCRNGHCFIRIEPLEGQHTNGGCNCLRELPVKLRLAVQAKINMLVSDISILTGELAAAKSVERQSRATIARQLELIKHLGGLVRSYEDSESKRLRCDKCHTKIPLPTRGPSDGGNGQAGTGCR